MGEMETMSKAETNVPVAVEARPAPMAMQAWRPFEGLEDFSLNPFRLSLRRPVFAHRTVLASWSSG